MERFAVQRSGIIKEETNEEEDFNENSIISDKENLNRKTKESALKMGLF